MIKNLLSVEKVKRTDNYKCYCCKEDIIRGEIYISVKFVDGFVQRWGAFHVKCWENYKK